MANHLFAGPTSTWNHDGAQIYKLRVPLPITDGTATIIHDHSIVMDHIHYIIFKITFWALFIFSRELGKC